MIKDMGLGQLGTNIVFKSRKFRFAFEVEVGQKKTGLHFVKVKGRPSIDGDLKIIDRTLETRFIDCFEDSHRGLFDVLAEYYDFGSQAFANAKSANELMKSTSGHLGKGILTLYDGCGNPLEKWTFEGIWPQSIDFGELCYSSDDTVEINVLWRFMEGTYENLCTGGLVPSWLQPQPENQVKIEDC